MWWIPALIGGAIRLTGNLIGRSRRKQAADDAIAIGRRNLIEGQDQATRNAEQLRQDNAYILALSGVSSDVGTAAMIDTMTHNAKAATVNKMSRDFSEWEEQVRQADTTDAINTGFNIAGDVFSAIGQLYYDRERFLQGQAQKAAGSGLGKNYLDHPMYKTKSYSITGKDAPFDTRFFY